MFNQRESDQMQSKIVNCKMLGWQYKKQVGVKLPNIVKEKEIKVITYV